MAQWNQETILALGRNFMESRVLLTAAELDLFTVLSPDPVPAREVALRLRGDERAATIVLDALSAMGLLEKSEGAYRCPASLAPLLTSHSPASVLPMLLHAANLWERWGELTAKVLGRGEGATAAADWQRAFIGAMHVVAGPNAERMVGLSSPGDARRLLDVGGASGTFTMAFLLASPEMTATLFDLPEVVEMARERLCKAGMVERVTLVPGDFNTDPLPGGHDLCWLSAIIHQNSPDENVRLYRKVFDALVTGGRVVIRDHVLSSDRLSPPSGAIFAVNMLVGTEGGNSYTFEEIRRELEDAGLVRVRLLHPDSRMDGLVEAFKP